MRTRRVSWVWTAAAVMLGGTLLLALVTTCSGLAWVGRPFPGFFLLRNRVIASVSLPGWPAALRPDVFQSTIVAVDDVAVASSTAVYARVAARPAGTRVAYTLERDGERSLEWIESRVFGWHDALLLFGPYLFDGLVFAAIGVWVWALSPRRATTWALLGLCLSLSTYALTGIDLYGPHRFFRLHALAEAYLPATLLHLALLFPVRRTTPRRAALVSYLPATVLALVYQSRLDAAAFYPHVHELATVCVLGGGVALLASVLWSYLRSPSPLVRHRVHFVAMGILLGFTVPGVVFALSVLAGGRVPVNTAALTAFMFPLSVAYAVQKRDLFEIDALVQRGFYYAILSGLVTAVYLGLAALATHVLHLTRFGHSTALSLTLTLGVLLALPRLRDRVQRLVDLIFGRRTYDPQEVLATASTALGATLELDEIVRLTLAFPADVLGVTHVALYLRGEGAFEETVTDHGRRPRCLEDDGPLARRLSTLPRALLRDPLDGVADPCRTEFDALAAELIVPLGCQGALIGFLVCGRPRSGAYFSVGDVSFLHTFANHAALSLQNARTFRDLALLNTDLERRVEERTEQLGRSTTQLSTSLAELGAAYRTLQTSQEQLVAAQKMVAFGRLAAGIAHEMNTPLGAALNGLRIAQELAAECEALVDAGAPPEERRGAFAELAALITNVDEWTRKAVAYIRSLKAHGRGGDGLPAPFELGRLLEHDLQPLLMHRLRLVGGALELRLASDLPELYGDRGRLGQVLANLLSNAIDACEGLPSERTHIIIEAMREEGEVVVHIHDRGIGVPEEARERIFEAFYTTKPPGKGTGLGLSIARDIVTGEFGGTLTCTACEPGGTTFTLRLPFMAASAGQTAAA